VEIRCIEVGYFHIRESPHVQICLAAGLCPDSLWEPPDHLAVIREMGRKKRVGNRDGEEGKDVKE